LGPLLFIIFINDLVEFGEENVKLYLFADDAKIYCHVKNLADKDNLQRGIENLVRLDKQMASFLKYKQMQNYVSTS